MRVAVISDIHANLAAFEAVIADWATVDAVWCLGDVVGYGPDPASCLDRIRGLTDTCIAGNHDWAATGRLPTVDFNDLAAEAAEWTFEQLSQESRDYLDNLELVQARGEYTLVHGSPRDPVWEYVLTGDQARENFACFESSVCFIGHSHVPLAFSTEADAPRERDPVRVEEPRYDQIVCFGDRRHIVNVGSVGQPRDGNPRARYLLLDTEQRCYVRRQVSYNIAATQKRMRRAGLPRLLWERLEIGR